jgi:putative aminopeptidase FrvX
MGVVDNWSGASLLPSLLESIRHQLRRHTFLFVGFTGEEHGLVGSASYVEHLTAAEKGQIQVMINLDTLALGPTKVWLTHSDRRYAAALFDLADTMHLPLQVMNADGVGDDDSHSFFNVNIPTLMVHSVTAKTFPILHTRADNFKAVRFGDYYTTYRLLAAYLAWIDLSGN